MSGPQRDLVGYGGNWPEARWPGGARLAVNFVINYEEGSEYAIPNGDEYSDVYLAEIAATFQPPPGRRLLAFESLYEYGSRVGAWRLLDLFTERKLRATVFAVGQAVELNPAPVQAMAQAGFEIACHHYRWIDYWDMPEAEEREHLGRAVAALERAAGRRPVGFYGGRTSLNTRRLVAGEGGFLYESDAYNDELPYRTDVAGRGLLIVPYMLDNNDFRYASLPGWGSGEEFYQYNRATFDQLYAEGARSPRMMSVGLHCRLSGRPGRAAMLAKFLDYVRGFDDVWVCTREEIARHWIAQHP
jgi:putative urate catabolism protein